MSKRKTANSNDIEQGKNTNQSIIIIVPKKRTSLKELFVREKRIGRRLVKEEISIEHVKALKR